MLRLCDIIRGETYFLCTIAKPKTGDMIMCGFVINTKVRIFLGLFKNSACLIIVDNLTMF